MKFLEQLGLRQRLTAVVIIGAVLTLGVLTLGFNLLLRSSLNTDANRVVQARAAAALETVKVTGGKVGEVRAPETADASGPDSQVWIFSGGTAVESPRAPQAVQSLVATLARGPQAYHDIPGSDTRLYVAPIVSHGQRVGAVVAALSIEPYERTAHNALIASLIFLGVVLLLIAVATRWVVGRALDPVARMTAEAHAWSESDLDHRFNAGEPHDELGRLAATFDEMLDRVASSLRHEQRFSAELSHELRTPLSAIVTEAELALQHEKQPEEYRAALERIASRAAQLKRILETLLMAARAETVGTEGTADAKQLGEQALATCSELAREQSVELELSLPASPLRIDVDTDTAERILTPLIENACRYGSSRVALRVVPDGDLVSFRVEDDGRGVDPAERERIFEPGERGSAAAANGTEKSAGLGLPLARRLARAVGGEVTVLGNSSEKGTAFEARLPLSSYL